MSKHVGFNYEILTDAKMRSDAKKQAEHINKLLKASAEGIVEIGRRLIAMREAMTPAVFRAWVECEFRWQQSTAANYMQTSKRFGHLDCLGMFQPTALIMLARTNVPEELVNKMIARARVGEIITGTMAKKALACEPGFVPTRKDAGLARKPESSRSIVNAPLEGISTSPPLTVEALQKSLDAFSASIPLLDLAPNDRSALANRFFELAVQLRTVPESDSRSDRPKMSSKSKSRELVGTV